MEQKIDLEHEIIWDNIEEIDEIGRGLIGSIHSVIYNGNDDSYVVKKVLKKQKDSYKTSNEICHMFLLKDHPNIVKIESYNISQDGNEVEFKMLLERGEVDLGKFCMIYPDYFKNADNILLLMSQILNGLYYMYTQKIAHRDLKIDNILYFEKDIFKISDFGCTVNFLKNDSRYVLGGKTGIQPPENKKIKGKSFNYDKTDIYSFGIIILQILGFLNDPREFTGKNEKEYDIMLQEYSSKAFNITESNLISEYIKLSLVYSYEKRPNIKEVIKKLGLESIIPKINFLPKINDLIINSFKELSEVRVVIKTKSDLYVTLIDGALNLCCDMDGGTNIFTFKKLNNNSFSMQIDCYYVGSSLHNQGVSLSKNFTLSEEWSFFSLNSRNTIFFRNSNLHFLGVDLSSKIILSGLISVNEEFIINLIK
jgi:serine/threonine protein kinase